jgi:hypothetical protein
MQEYDEYIRINSGDIDIDKRVVKTLKQISREPSASIQRACGDAHQAKAVYRLLSNRKFNPRQVTKVSGEESVERITESGASTILIVQDSSELNYQKLRETTGLGVIGSSEKNRGVILHSGLGVGVDNEIYGLLGQEVIVREIGSYGSRHERKRKVIAEKESNKWVKMMEESQRVIPAGVLGVHISDREGDIYEYYERAEQIGSKYLCRRTHSRRTAEKSEINKYIDKLPVSGSLTIQVPRDSHTKRKAREAKLTVKFGGTEILRPQNIKTAKGSNTLGKLAVYVISAVETDAPSDVGEPISWQLITNLPVDDFDGAVEKINWYTKRWRIEDFHHVLKSGCSIEKRQASSEEKLEKLIALYSVIAVDLLRLTWLARVNPDVSCETLFAPREWKILYCVAAKTRTLPKTPPTLYGAVRLVAILGGFLNRKSDGEPGVKSIWIGLSKLHTILFAKQFF